MPEITIEHTDYHRNGVSGEGFYVVLFTDAEHGSMVGIVFPLAESDIGLSGWGNPRVAVLQRDLLKEGNVNFGVNSWRGDQYAGQLYAACGLTKEGLWP